MWNLPATWQSKRQDVIKWQEFYPMKRWNGSNQVPPLPSNQHSGCQFIELHQTQQPGELLGRVSSVSCIRVCRAILVRSSLHMIAHSRNTICTLTMAAGWYLMLCMFHVFCVVFFDRAWNRFRHWHFLQKSAAGQQTLNYKIGPKKQRFFVSLNSNDSLHAVRTCFWFERCPIYVPPIAACKLIAACPQIKSKFNST